MQTQERATPDARIESANASRRGAAVAIVVVTIAAVGVAAFLLRSDNGIATVAGDGVLTVEIMTDYNALPFADSTGDPVSGFDVDLLAEMASRAGLTVETTEPLSSFSPAALHHLLLAEQGSVDVVAQGLYTGIYEYLAANPNADQFRGIDVTRAENPALFTDPYYLEDFALIVDPVANPDIRSTSDLGSETAVSVWEDSAADAWVVANLEPSGVTVRRTTNSSPLAPLAAAAINDVVAVIHSLPRAEALLAENPALEIVEVIEAGQPLGFAVNPSNPELHAALNEALRAMVADGTYGSIYDRWFEDDSGSVAP